MHTAKNSNNNTVRVINAMYSVRIYSICKIYIVAIAIYKQKRTIDSIIICDSCASIAKRLRQRCNEEQVQLFFE